LGADLALALSRFRVTALLHAELRRRRSIRPYAVECERVASIGLASPPTCRRLSRSRIEMAE